MSRRNTRPEKQLRRLRKALRVGLPAQIDLIQWLIDRDYASSRREALQLLADGRLRSESHPLRQIYAPASYRETLRVIDA